MNNTSNLIKCALMCAICAAVSQLYLPLPGGVPLTVQCFSVSLCGFILGKKWGSVSVLVFLLLGASGLPVFSGFRGGVTAFLAPQGGFMIGFLPLAFFSGFGKGYKKVLCGIAGVILCHAIGVIYFACISGIGIINAVIYASFPFVGKDILLVIFSYIVSEKILSIMKRG